MRIDAHQHFWSLENPWTEWPTPDLGEIYRDFGTDDLAPLLEQTGVSQTVLVQAAPHADETRDMLKRAAGWDRVGGVVGWVDFADPAGARGDLDSFTADPLFVGVRPMLQAIDDDAWILGTPQREVLGDLERRRLTFDALIQPRHLTAMAEIADRHPDLQIIIDHAAKPDIRSRKIDEWAQGMRRLAQSENVAVKLSGLLTEAAPGDGGEALEPYVAVLLETFGPARMMWGSDWPVINLVSDYVAWAETVDRMIRGLPEDDRAAVWGGTARRIYRLKTRD